jgi:hypothetical protein
MEGGNAPVIDRNTGETLHSAEKINVKEIGRDRLRKELIKVFEAINKNFEEEYDEPIWHDFSVITNGTAFNGSSTHLFDPKVSSADYVKHKGSTGDVDVTVPKEKLPKIFELFAKHENEDITNEFHYLGQNKRKFYGHQINAVFQLKKPKTNVQIDFEGVDYNENHSPTEFSKFGHNSAWEDIQQGIKGMAHKLLLQNLARALSKMGDVVVLTPSSPSEPADKIKISSSASHAAPTNIAFSVDLGTREKYAPAVDSKGNQVYVNGKPAFRELKTTDSKYHKDIDVIYTMIFKKKPSKDGKDLKKFHSFTGVLSLLKTHKVSEEMIQNMFKSLIEKDFFGKGAQGYEKNNPEGDKEIKMKIVDLLLKQFPFLKQTFNGYEEMIETYYKNYRMVKVES